MMDIIVLISTVVFFLIALAYVQGCESLWTQRISWGWYALSRWQSIWFTRCYILRSC